jgi:hypothetical protein
MRVPCRSVSRLLPWTTCERPPARDRGPAHSCTRAHAIARTIPRQLAQIVPSESPRRPDLPLAGFRIRQEQHRDRRFRNAGRAALCVANLRLTTTRVVLVRSERAVRHDRSIAPPGMQSSPRRGARSGLAAVPIGGCRLRAAAGGGIAGVRRQAGSRRPTVIASGGRAGRRPRRSSAWWPRASVRTAGPPGVDPPLFLGRRATRPGRRR